MRIIGFFVIDSMLALDSFRQFMFELSLTQMIITPNCESTSKINYLKTRLSGIESKNVLENWLVGRGRGCCSAIGKATQL